MKEWGKKERKKERERERASTRARRYRSKGKIIFSQFPISSSHGDIIPENPLLPKNHQ